MQSAPLPENEASRLRDLQQYQVLDTQPEEAFDDLTALAAQICETPIALVSLVDAHRQWFKSKAGIDVQETPRDIAFCAHAIHGDDLFVVPDTTQDQRFADNPLVTADPNIRFYAGMPLVTPTGHALGTLCVIDRAPKQITVDQMTVLRILGRQVVNLLELRRQRGELHRSLVMHQKSERSKADIIRAIDHGLEGLAFLDTEGCFTYMNPAHASIYGYTPQELISRSWKTLYAPNWIVEIEQQYFPILLNVGRWTGEVQGRTKSGHEIFVEISLVLSQEGHDPDHWLMCTCRDVTERVTAQRQLQAEQESLAQAQALAHVGSWEWDVDTGIATWSDEQFRIFGYMPHTITPTVDTFHKAIHPEDQASVLKAVEDTLERNQPFEVICRIIRPNRESRHILCRGRVTHNLEGRPKRMAGTVQDITEQKAFEQILNDTIQRLDLATKSGGIGVWDYYIPENKLVWDKQMYELYGYTLENFPGAYEAWTSRLHPEDKANAEAALQACIEGRGQFDTGFRLVLPNMVLRHIKASAVVLKDEQGKAVRMIGINYDITAQKLAEAEVAAATAELRSVTIAIDAVQGIAEFALDGTLLTANDNLLTWMGYRLDEIKGQHHRVLCDPDYASSPAYQAFWQKLIRGEFDAGVYRRLGKGGKEFWIQASYIPITDATGKLTKIMKFAVDITAQKMAETARQEQEARLRAIVDHAVDGIITIDERGTIDSFNPAAERLFGYSATEAIGQNVKILMPEPYQSKHDGYLAHYQQTGQAKVIGTRSEVVGRRQDGSAFPLDLSVSEMWLGNRRLFTGITRDITERKSAEAKLAEAHEQALAATKAKSEFLASMSHEIRTPMNAIVAMADLLQETPLSKEQQEYVGRFSRAAASLLDLINDILDISKIEAGQLGLESLTFDIHDLVDKIGEMMAIRAHAKQLEIATFVHPDVPIWVSGDPTRLRQVLVNLVGNAIKFTEQGEVVLRVEPNQTDPGTLRCSISDTGIGIPADKVESIFESFTQVDSSTTRKYGGTGLGLSISKRLVELMGGHIEVDSTEGVGSTFSFVVTLPRAFIPRTSSPSPAPDLRHRRLLIVDDAETNRMVVREHLKKFGSVLVEAPDAPAALRALDEAHREGKPFDLAILDYHMPSMKDWTSHEPFANGKTAPRCPWSCTPRTCEGTPRRERASWALPATPTSPSAASGCWSRWPSR
jgi:PAS domain S-box-containing protein